MTATWYSVTSPVSGRSWKFEVTRPLAPSSVPSPASIYPSREKSSRHGVRWSWAGAVLPLFSSTVTFDIDSERHVPRRDAADLARVDAA
jgi:hypothetical protein